MPKKKTDKKAQLSWDNDAMTWRDEKGKAVTHERYANSPRSLDGKSFIKGYLRSVQDGDSLNDYMKTHGAHKSSEIQKAAKNFQALVQEAQPGFTMTLLKKKKLKTDANKKAKSKAVTDAMAELLKIAGDDSTALLRKIATRKPQKS